MVALVLFVILIGGTFTTFAQSVSDSSVSKEVGDYIKGVLDEGNNGNSVKNIKKVDVNNLPDDVEIKQVDKNNVGIYQVDYQDSNSDSKQVYVVTYSTDNLEAKTSGKNVQYFSFGSNLAVSGSDYLYTSSGAKSGGDVGYVMMRPGSITGISTSLAVNSGDGNLEIKIYKNGKDTGFSNLISTQSGKKVDYDTQSEELVTYEAGDVISVYVLTSDEEINWERVVTLVETTS